MWRGAGHIAGAAAAIALVVPQTDDERTRLIDFYDLGQATYAIALAAADLGIGTGHASVSDQDRARQILSVPADHDVAFLIGVGTRPPAAAAHRQTRPPPAHESPTTAAGKPSALAVLNDRPFSAPSSPAAKAW